MLPQPLNARLTITLLPSYSVQIFYSQKLFRISTLIDQLQSAMTITNAPIQQHAIMFADVSGSSALYKQVGNEKAKSIIDEAINFMVALTIVHEGTVVKTIGDEIMARFDDCTQACETACAIQHRCLKEPQLAGLSIRIGIAFGPTLLTEHDVFGDTVNDAACVAHIARAGQIVLTQSVVDQLSAGLLDKCQMYDRIHTKGDSSKTVIYRLLWETSLHRERAATIVMATHEVTRFIEKFQLKLTLGKREICLLPDQMPYKIGRDPEQTHLQIDNHVASRDHCHIEFRRGKYVLVDHSTNGTYVCGTDQAPIYLRREELPLQGTGAIGIGQPTDIAGEWLIQYQL